MTAPPDTQRPIPPNTARRESEGGALPPCDAPVLPDGIVAIAVTHYRVGAYTYTNLDDAMAQHRRQGAL